MAVNPLEADISISASSPSVAAWSCAVRFAFGIDNARFAWRCGNGANGKAQCSLIFRLNRPVDRRLGTCLHANIILNQLIKYF